MPRRQARPLPEPRGGRTEARRNIHASGHSIGKLSIPKGVAQLLGGADYGTITGWYRSEIGAVYRPLVIAALAITAASACTAGEEEDRILGHRARPPVTRTHLIAGVALGGGGISVAHVSAFSVQLAFFGFDDPLTHGVDAAGIILLGAVALLLTAVAMVAIERRDLRA